jgi:hypothetical protein
VPGGGRFAASLFAFNSPPSLPDFALILIGA